MMSSTPVTADYDQPEQRADMVLVVDDSPESLSLINDALETAGIEVLVALEGRQALNIARKMKPDMILMDAIMPNMDGFEACRLLKSDAELAAIPVIFMTGLTETEHVVKGLEAGGVDYLVKPIKPQELLARMRVHLKNARLTRSAHTALDSTGQHLFTVSADGVPSWATPQTHALLARARVDDLTLKAILAPQMQDWLQQGIQPADTLQFADLVYPLAARLVEKQADGQWLLKLIDGERPTGAPMLRQQLGLTERESEVLFWIANGKANREAAEILGMSPRTVNKHLEQVFVKLGVENRTAAAGIALRLLAVE